MTDSVGNQAHAFLGIFVFAEGFDDLFVEFLGPYEVPAGEVVPLHSFIVGGEELSSDERARLKRLIDQAAGEGR